MKRRFVVVLWALAAASSWAEQPLAPKIEAVPQTSVVTVPSLAAAPLASALPAAAVPALPGALTAAAAAAAPAAGAAAPVSARSLALQASVPALAPLVFDASSRSPAPAEPAAWAASSDASSHDAGLRRSTPVYRTYASPEGAQARELRRLETSLSENGLPPAKSKVFSEAVDADRPTVAILAPASRHKVAIAREGGRQSPGDVHLALDASWLIQEQLPDGRTKLLLKKGVTFDENGQATIVEYKVPRVVRYFANYFTLGANDRADGVPFERNLDVPQSNSTRLEAIVNDKMRMSLLGTMHGVEVPAMLTFAMPENPIAGAAGVEEGRVRVAAMPEGAEKAQEIRRRVDAFLDGYEGEEIVVKPSGPQFHSGRGVKFFRKDQRAEIAAHALALSSDPMMTKDGAVIVTGRVSSAPLFRDGRKMETTLRVLAARAPWGGAVTTEIFGRVGPWGKPTTAEAADPRDNATVEPWERLLKEWGLSPEKARALDARVRAMGENMLESIMTMETGLARADGEPYRAETDLIGLDVMIEKRGDELVPVMIEVNDHDAGGQYNLDRQIATDRVGTHSRIWVATMLQRARRDALRGKTIAIVGAGYQGKIFTFQKARELGVNVVLVDKPGIWAEKFPNVHLIPTTNESPDAFAKAKEGLRAWIAAHGKIDALTTFWEDDVVLAADLAHELGLPYHTPEAARAARDKQATQKRLAEKGVRSSRSAFVKNLFTASDAADRKRLIAEFLAAARRVTFPAVLKPLGGAAQIGTVRVNSEAEALEAYEKVSRIVNPARDPIFARNSDLVLMEYLDGEEYDVDLVMRAGQPIFSSVTDNKPTREPSFEATGSRLPSVLPAARQQEAAQQAIDSARALGLNDGVIHMEGKYTSRGARLIEANARMGGAYVRDWVRDVWGVDLAEENLMAAARIPGKPFKPAEPLRFLDGDFVNWETPGVLKKIELPEKARKMPGFRALRLFAHVGDRVVIDKKGGSFRLAMVEAEGKTPEEARRNREAIEALLDVVVE